MKRGASQIDWIMSLALFLLWVAWFFIFIKPQIDISSNQNADMLNLKNSFQDEFDLQLERFLMFIEANRTGTYLPVIFETNLTDIRFIKGYPYFFYGNKLIFLANLTGNVTGFHMLSGSSYNNSYGSSGLEIEQNMFSTTNMTVRFDDGLVDSMRYKSRGMLDDISYSINGADVVPEEYNFTDYGFMGLYWASMGNFNLTQMLFSENQEVWLYPNYFHDYELRLDFAAEDFDSYYSSNILFGDFNYTAEKNSAIIESDYITLYGKNAVSFYFENNVTCNFTYYNDTIEASVDVPISKKDQKIRIVLHDGDYLDVSRYDYDIRFGPVVNLEGIFLSNISTNYSRLKSKWGLKQDFNIQVYLNSSAYTYLYDPEYTIGVQPGKVQVYSEKIDMNSLDVEGTYKPISVVYRIW